MSKINQDILKAATRQLALEHGYEYSKLEAQWDEVFKWKPKAKLPEPDFSLDELEAAEKVIRDLG